MDKLTFTNVSNITINDFLRRFYVAKKTIYKILNNKLIKVNNKEVGLDYVINKKDNISIQIDEFEVSKSKPWEFPLDIIYEDEDILLLNKPISILVHTDGSDEHTLENAVSYYYQSNNINRQVRHIHRLDYDTSGVILYAKHFLAHSFLSHQIEHKEFKKTYVAIIQGQMKNKEGRIELSIGRDRHNSNKYLVSSNGKEAITNYKTLNYKNGKSLVEIDLETGRTHQIRVHFSHLNHPLIGDKLYGIKASRLMLHSYRISFIHPRNMNQVAFKAPVPKDFQL